MKPVIAVEGRDLVCVRGQRVLLRDLSFAVAGGQALIVEGPNGAGKTSLLRMIAGFLPQAAGTIRLRTDDGGEALRGEDRMPFVGFLGHKDALKPQLTARENLAFFARLYGQPGNGDAALDWAGLSRCRDLPGQFLSAGQKKRLALARLKLIARPLWLLDEPLASLDAAGKALVAGMIAAHCAGGGIAIAATHEPLGLEAARITLGRP